MTVAGQVLCRCWVPCAQGRGSYASPALLCQSAWDVGWGCNTLGFQIKRGTAQSAHTAHTRRPLGNICGVHRRPRRNKTSGKQGDNAAALHCCPRKIVQLGITSTALQNANPQHPIQAFIVYTLASLVIKLCACQELRNAHSAEPLNTQLAGPAAAAA